MDFHIGGTGLVSGHFYACFMVIGGTGKISVQLRGIKMLFDRSLFQMSTQLPAMLVGDLHGYYRYLRRSTWGGHYKRVSQSCFGLTVFVKVDCSFSLQS
jgi:hypothetical protein